MFGLGFFLGSVVQTILMLVFSGIKIIVKTAYKFVSYMVSQTIKYGREMLNKSNTQSNTQSNSREYKYEEMPQMIEVKDYAQSPQTTASRADVNVNIRRIQQIDNDICVRRKSRA